MHNSFQISFPFFENGVAPAQMTSGLSGAMADTVIRLTRAVRLRHRASAKSILTCFLNWKTWLFPLL